MYVCSLKNHSEFDFVNKNGIKITGRFFLIVLSSLNLNPSCHQPKAGACHQDKLLTNNVTNNSHAATTNDVGYNNIITHRLIPYQPPLLAFGMKVSKKFAKKAVTRNQVKRRIRHIIRLISKNHVHLVKNKSIIIIPRTSCLTADFSALLSDFKHILYKHTKS